MNTTNLDYSMESFDENNVNTMLNRLGINASGYFIAMASPSLSQLIFVGSFGYRNCIICFSETELNLIMLSRMTNTKATELIKIQRNEISNIKMSDILLGYKLSMKANGKKMKFQIHKSAAKFPKIGASIELFKQFYSL